MFHVLTISYSRYNLFNQKMEDKTHVYKLTWEGVKYMMNNTYYKKHNAHFTLAPYTGQKVDN